MVKEVLLNSGGYSLDQTLSGPIIFPYHSSQGRQHYPTYSKSVRQRQSRPMYTRGLGLGCE